MPADERVLIFGAGGAIGSALTRAFANSGWDVVGSGRGTAPANNPATTWISYDPFQPSSATTLASIGKVDAVIWAQGANLSDSVHDFDAERHLAAYKANCLFNIQSLHELLKLDALAAPARLLVISSIWQDIARQDKLSYCVSKSAVRGFVLSACVDLAPQGHLINAILPGALDTPMTHQALGVEKMARLAGATPFGKLPALSDVVNLAGFLCSRANTGITGQFIKADLGFSDVRQV